MRIKLLDPNCMPVKKHPTDAGWDLKARLEGPILIEPGTVVQVPAGLAVEIPDGYVGDIRPRSGLTKKGIVAQYGTVDAPYRGEILVNIANISREAYELLPYERMAQLVILPVFLENLEVADTLSDTERGDRGFGSSGRL